jgi:hypothetical protein
MCLLYWEICCLMSCVLYSPGIRHDTVSFQMKRCPTRHYSPSLRIDHYMSRECGNLDVSQTCGSPRPVTGTAVRFSNGECWGAVSVGTLTRVYCFRASRNGEVQLEGGTSEDRIPRNINWKRNLKISHYTAIQLSLSEEDISGVTWIYIRGMSHSNLVETPIAQAVSRRLPTAEARVRSQVRSCGISGGQSGTRVGFLRVLRFPLPVLISEEAGECFSQSLVYGSSDREGFPEPMWATTGQAPLSYPHIWYVVEKFFSLVSYLTNAVYEYISTLCVGLPL